MNVYNKDLLTGYPLSTMSKEELDNLSFEIWVERMTRDEKKKLDEEPHTLQPA